MKKIWKIGLIAVMSVMLTGCRGKVVEKIEASRSQGMEYMQQSAYQEAIDSFEAAYVLCDEKMPETKTDILLFEAACQMKMEEYAQVEATCSKILELNENADAHYMRGTAFLRTGESEMARADFDRVSELVPEQYAVFLNIYQEYEALNQSALGDDYLQVALNNPGETIEDDYQKACIYFYLKDYQKAQEALAKPVEEQHEGAILMMGQVYLELGESVQARNVFQQYIDAYGENAQAYNGMALCEIADGNYETAFTHIQRGLELASSQEEMKELMYNEIVVYEKQNNFEMAKRIAEEFVEEYPNDEAGKKEYDFLRTR